MVLTSVVALLPLAAPQLTIERVWRLAMMQGGADTRGLSGVDYGEVGFGQDQFLVPAPGLAEKELLEMTRAGASVNAIKREIVHTGKWWVWMRPDKCVATPYLQASYAGAPKLGRADLSSTLTASHVPMSPR